MKRKLLSSLLALSMVTMLFTGCGKEEPVTNEVVENAQVEEEEAKEPEVIESEITEVEEVESETTDEAAYPDDMVIEFNDKNVESYVRDWVDKNTGEITYSDIQEIHSIYFIYDEDGELTDLSPFLYFPNIKSIHLEGYENIDFIDVMSSYQGIKEIKLRDIEDVSGIANFTSLEGLESLCLHDCYLDERVSFLSNFKFLKHLEIYSSYTFYEWFDDNGIAAISNMTSLETFYLNYELNDSAVTLSGLKNLTSVEISSANIGLLSETVSIKELKVYDSIVSDISVIGTLTNLEKLTLEDCEYVQDISPIANCTKLKELYMTGVVVLEDISPLSALSSLEMLDIIGSRALSDISVLGELTSLKKLCLKQCKEIRDISSIGNLVNLEKLSIMGCNIDDIKPIDNLKNLKEARIDYQEETLYTLEDVKAAINQ